MAQRLAADDIAIYEHRYAALDFGSWEIVAGRRKSRIRFRWDGRDAALTIEQAVCADSRTPLNWKSVASEQQRSPDGANPLARVEQFFRGDFGA